MCLNLRRVMSCVQPFCFFHGAGFSAGKARLEQFQHHAHYFSALGFVSICVEYRPRHIDGLFSPVTGIKHAKTAVRQVRAQSALLGIDPCRIVVAGASAGGYLALCTAMIETVTDLPDDLSGDLSVSSVPDVLIIFNGGVDTAVLIEMFPELSVDLAGASPKDHVRGFLPPSLFFHGTQDENIPYATVEEFVDAMWKSGNDSRLVRFEGLGHGFFNYGNYDNIPYQRTLQEIVKFLDELGYIY